MKWIADEDERKIREARELIADMPPVILLRNGRAARLLDDVLSSIHALAQEQPHPEPRIVELSEAEMRRIYPER